MATTNFINGTTTVVAEWLNEVDAHVYANFDVTHYGAVGDGVTDDSPAVQAALTALVAAGKGVLWFPTGDFLFNSRVSVSIGVDLRISGTGFATTKLLSNNTDGCFTVDFSTDGSREYNVQVSNLSFHANIADAGTAFQMTEALGGNRHERMFVAENVQVLCIDPAATYFTKGFDLYGVWRPWFNNVLITGPYTSATDQQAMSIGISVDECYSPEFSATQVWNCDEGISYDSTSSPGPEGFWMSNGCKVVECNTCVSVSSTSTEPSMSIIGCHINGLLNGVKINKWKYIRLANNLFYSSGTASNFISATDVVELRSSDNQFHFPSLDANTNIGINVLGTSVGVYSSNDYFNRMGGAGIRVSLGSSDVKVINPTFENTITEVEDLSNSTVRVDDVSMTAYGDGATSGPEAQLFRDSASPATNDVLGRHVFSGRNSAGEVVEYAASRGQIIDPVDGSEDGTYQVFAMIGGTLTRVAEFRNGMTLGLPTGGEMGVGTLNLNGNTSLFLSLNGGAGIYSGTGTPEGAVAAAIGSTYHRTDGGAGTSFYVKQSGAGNTGWVGK